MAYSMDASLLHAIHRAAQAATDVFARDSKTDCTARQMVVLAAIAENTGLNQTNIVERTGIDRSTLADIVRRLQKKGLVTRQRTKQDARAVAVSLTTAGAAQLRLAAEQASRAEKRLVAGLTEKQRSDLLKLLQAVATAGEKKADQR